MYNFTDITLKKQLFPIDKIVQSENTKRTTVS